MTLIRRRSNRLIPNRAVLSGNSGSNVTTPDSASTSITGDIEIVARIRPNDNTPASGQYIIAVRETNSQRAYYFLLNSDGTLNFNTSSTGSDNVANQSTAANGKTDGNYWWVRVTLDVDDGGGNRVANFYTSDDDTTDPSDVVWVQLGATVTTAGATSIFDSTSKVEIGSNLDGASALFAGHISRVVVYNGIGGAANIDFNPLLDARTQSQKTFVSSATGETWTVNGDAFLK